MNVSCIAEKECAAGAKLCGDAVVHVISRKPVHAIDLELQGLDDCLTNVCESEFLCWIRRIYLNAADQSNVSIFFQREQREEIGGVELEIDFTVYWGSLRLHVRDVEQGGVGPA